MAFHAKRDAVAVAMGRQDVSNRGIPLIADVRIVCSPIEAGRFFDRRAVDGDQPIHQQQAGPRGWTAFQNHAGIGRGPLPIA
jgi:hypothetical protein